MSAADLELIRRVFAAFDARDMEQMEELLAPEIEFLPVTANLTTGGVAYRGYAGIRRYFEEVDQVWSRLRLHPEHYRALDDGGVLVLGRVRATGGGIVSDRPTAWLWRIEDGRVVSGRIYTSHEEALAAAGLPE